MPKKVRTFCFGILVKKLAHTHGFEHETSGLKSKHLTTRPRTRESCELPREIRVVARKKKHPHFPITLAYRKCKKQYCQIIKKIDFFQNFRSSSVNRILPKIEGGLLCSRNALFRLKSRGHFGLSSEKSRILPKKSSKEDPFVFPLLLHQKILV